MKTVINLTLIAAAISLILSFVSRVTFNPLPIFQGGLEAEALLSFTNTCLLAAIVMLLMQTTKN